jgi:sugar phosphate isomerase/epimerase
MTETHTRRSFIAGLAAAAAATGIGSLLPSDLHGATAPLIPGIQLYMVKNELQQDTAGTLAKLAAIGYRDVEYFALPVYTATQFRKLANDAGLRCPSGHFAFGMEDTEKLLDDAGALGAHYVISSILPAHPMKNVNVETIVQGLNHLQQDDFKLMAKKANEIGKKAHERGMQFAYHNHNIEFRKFDNGETGYSIIMKETDAELVKFEADIGWMARGGADALALFNTSPMRFPLLHFKDFAAIDPPVTTLGTDGQQIVELGKGVVPFKPMVEAGKKFHVEYYIVDQDPPFHNKTAFEAAKIDFDYLSGLLAG